MPLQGLAKCYLDVPANDALEANGHSRNPAVCRSGQRLPRGNFVRRCSQLFPDQAQRIATQQQTRRRRGTVDDGQQTTPPAVGDTDSPRCAFAIDVCHKRVPVLKS